MASLNGIKTLLGEELAQRAKEAVGATNSDVSRFIGMPPQEIADTVSAAAEPVVINLSNAKENEAANLRRAKELLADKGSQLVLQGNTPEDKARVAEITREITGRVMNTREGLAALEELTVWFLDPENVDQATEEQMLAHELNAYGFGQNGEITDPLDAHYVTSNIALNNSDTADAETLSTYGDKLAEIEGRHMEAFERVVAPNLSTSHPIQNVSQQFRLGMWGITSNVVRSLLYGAGERGDKLASYKPRGEAIKAVENAYTEADQATKE